MKANRYVLDNDKYFFWGLSFLLIGLKLGKIIDWSWWWVLAPLWAPPVFLLLCVGLGYLVFKTHQKLKKV
jgi:membrane protein DedA with SNARE-associated domain